MIRQSIELRRMKKWKKIISKQNGTLQSPYNSPYDVLINEK